MIKLDIQNQYYNRNSKTPQKSLPRQSSNNQKNALSNGSPSSDYTKKFLCIVCNKPTLLCCNKCNNIFYCSPEHQQQHWPMHKSQCIELDNLTTKRSADNNVQHPYNEFQDYNLLGQSQSTPILKAKNNYAQQQPYQVDFGLKQVSEQNDWEDKSPYKQNDKANQFEIEDQGQVQAHQDQQMDIDQLKLARKQLRSIVVQLYSINNFKDSIIPIKKLIKYSTLIYEQEKTLIKEDMNFIFPQFGGSESNLEIQLENITYHLEAQLNVYEMFADNLLLIKSLIKIDKQKSAREYLIQLFQQMQLKFDEILEAKGPLIKFLRENPNENSYNRQQILIKDSIMNHISKQCNLISLTANLFYAIGDQKNCENAYVFYVKIVESLNGPNDLETANAYFLIGVFYLQHKYFLKSLACFKRCISTRISVLGENHDSVADCWYNIGIVYKQLENKQEALNYLDKSLQIRQKNQGEFSLQAANVKETIGKVLLESNSYEECFQQFQKCYNIRKQVLNDLQHPDMIRISLLIIHLFNIIKQELDAKENSVLKQATLQKVQNSISHELLDQNLNNYLVNEKITFDKFNVQMQQLQMQQQQKLQDSEKAQQDSADQSTSNSQSQQAQKRNKYRKSNFKINLDEELIKMLQFEQLQQISELNSRIQIQEEESVAPINVQHAVVQSAIIKELSQNKEIFKKLKSLNQEYFPEEVDTKYQQILLKRQAQQQQIQQTQLQQEQNRQIGTGGLNEIIQYQRQSQANLAAQQAQRQSQAGTGTFGLNLGQAPVLPQQSKIGPPSLLGLQQSGAGLNNNGILSQPPNITIFSSDSNAQLQPLPGPPNLNSLLNQPSGLNLQTPSNLGPPPLLLGPPNLLSAGLGGNQPPSLNLGPPSLGQLNLGGSNLGPQALGSLNMGGPPSLGSLNLGPPNLGSLNLGPPSLGSLNLGGPPNLGPPNLGGLMQPQPNNQLLLPQVQQANLGPKSKTKQIFWEKLNSNTQNTIWSQLKGEKFSEQKQDEEIKFDELEDLFGNAPVPQAPSKSKSQTLSKTSSTNSLDTAANQICLFPDSKKAYNMNIMLSKFRKYKLEELVEGIVKMDKKIMNSDNCLALKPYIPDNDEIILFKNYDQSPDQLDKPSQFFYYICQNVQRYGQRIEFTIFEEDFEGKIKGIQKDSQILNKACDTLKNSEKFKKFLKVVLDLGNKMNQGTNKGQADGFKLSSLNTLMNVKSNKGNVTLFQYLVKQLYQQKPEILKFTDEFEIFKESMQLNIMETSVSMQQIKQKFTILEQQMLMARQSNPPDQGFIDAFYQFYQDNLQVMLQTEADVNKSKLNFEEVQILYGEDAQIAKAKSNDEFYKMLYQISEQVKNLVKQEERSKKISKK